jgi:prefoldin subunit 5
MTEKENNKIKKIVAEYRRIYRQVQHLEDRMALIKKEQDSLIEKLTSN